MMAKDFNNKNAGTKEGKAKDLFVNSTLARDNLITLSGNFPINSRYGDTVYGANNQRQWTLERFPAVADIGFEYGIGYSQDKMSPANRAVDQMWQWAVYGSSRSVSFSKEDLFIYEVAVATCYMLHAWMKRLYGALNYMSPVNSTLPDSLCAGLHITPTLAQTFRDKRANFCDYINKYADYLSVYPLPKSFRCAQRWINLVSSIYRDEDREDDFCQFYVLNPMKIFKWQVTETGSKGEVQLFTTLFNSETELKNLVEGALNRLQNDDDIGHITAQLLQTYGTDMYSLEPVPYDYKVKPIYSPDFMKAWANATIIPASSADLSEAEITQDPVNGGIYYAPKAASTAVPVQFYRDFGAFVNAEPGKDNPLEWFVKTTWTALPSGNQNIALKSSGMEIIRRVRMCYGVNPNQYDNYQNFINAVPSTAENSLILSSMENSLNKFSVMPRRYWYDSDDTNYPIIYMSGDVSRFTVLNQNELFQLHESRILNELGWKQVEGNRAPRLNIK